MSYYESVFITRQELGEKEIKSIIDNLTGVLKKNNASVLYTEMWGLRNLAYKIKKNKKGHYVMFQIQGDGIAIKELERNMKIDENVIRFLSLKINKVSKEPSIMMKKANDIISEGGKGYLKSDANKKEKKSEVLAKKEKVNKDDIKIEKELSETRTKKNKKDEEVDKLEKEKAKTETKKSTIIKSKATTTINTKKTKKEIDTKKSKTNKKSTKGILK